jgi:hypothetical protein
VHLEQYFFNLCDLKFFSRFDATGCVRFLCDAPHFVWACFRFLFVTVRLPTEHFPAGRNDSASPTRGSVIFFPSRSKPKEPQAMEWTTPKHEEIDLNCEISSYANAEL